MNLLLLTPPDTIGNELPLVIHFLQCGLHKLHIRKPGFGIGQYRDYITAIPASFHQRLVIHGAYELASSFPGIGIHLRSDDRQNRQLLQQARQWRAASYSSSFHGWQEIRDNDDAFDYAFISPVFDSISKKGYQAAIDLEELRPLQAWAAAHKKQLPGIVGLGGVNATTIPLLRQAGFQGAALLGAIWEAAEPAAAFAAIQAASDNPAGA